MDRHTNDKQMDSQQENIIPITNIWRGIKPSNKFVKKKEKEILVLKVDN